ncbi:MAG: glycoside hydrolase family 99-like domain-containing protein [Alistipes sp.]
MHSHPAALSEKDGRPDRITVACYYFPNYHTHDRRNDSLKGDGWAEWELVKKARPCFDGQQQPKVPAWGYTDEKDPAEMARKIDAAADNGVDVFIFDWYYYDDGPFLNRALDEGFLKAPNTEKLKFALMWANHDWLDIHPYTKGDEQKILYPGRVTPETFDKIGDLIIKEYFTKPNYWTVDGKPYFSVYDVQKFVENFGSVEAARAAMDKLREKAVAAGLPGVHWNLVTWGNPVLPGEKAAENTPELLKKLGFDSGTSYVWIHHTPLPDLQTDYIKAMDDYFAFWDKARAEYGVPYYPNVTMGWDPSPRYVEQTPEGIKNYLVTYTIGNNTPENFREALQRTKDRLLADPNGPRILNINSWNE